MSRVLVIGDIHEPFSRTGYLQFCMDMCRRWRCNRVVFIGDIVDSHTITFHDVHPDADGPVQEFEKALERVNMWKRAFPEALVCIGNHDERYTRVAASVNIPALYMKGLHEVWKTKKWKWAYDHVIDGVYYFHGTGNSGEHPAYNAMKKMLMSTVMGHNHTALGVKWTASPVRRVFGLDVGCGVDDRQLAFSYGRHMKRRSVLGCGVVIDGIPYAEVMPIGKGEKYHDSKARC